MRTLFGLLLTLVALCLTACVGQKGAVNYMFKHPDVLAQLCSERYPVAETYVPGVPQVKHNIIPGQLILCPPATKDSTTGEMKPGTVKCPDSFKDSVVIRDTIRWENTAKIAVLERDLAIEKESRKDADDEVIDLEDKNETLKWAILALTLMVIVLLICLIRK